MLVGAVPAAELPEMRLLPKESVDPPPEIPVLFMEMSVFDSRVVPPLWTPVPLWVVTLLSTLISAPGSSSIPAAVLPEKTELLIIMRTPLPAATPKLAFSTRTLSSVAAMVVAPLAGAIFLCDRQCHTFLSLILSAAILV